MLRQRFAVALVASLLAGSTVLPAFAQNAAPAPVAPAAPAAPATPEPTPEQMSAALDFLTASGLTSGFDDTILTFAQQTNQVYSNQRPELHVMINDATVALVPEFLKQRVDLDRGLAKLYIAQFSVDELKQLAEFYHTPVGQKFAKQQQTIVKDSFPVVQAWTRTLQADIAKRIKEEVGKRGGQL
jgi:uncharacterized protein